ncbi:unnamed protein product [Trichogramma brassicae]|uniref:Uncharacterized protein n=1 Tax=Trichogramma brassicae TaxID=86971 RepID=A0A6H5I2T8_9HYME|nr:unnamed protein product [Trichogramma brassicae]
MHLATLDGSAVVLVSASAISLVLLAKRYLAKIKLSSQGVIQWLSDIANSILTAVLIVLHRSYVVSATEVDRRSRSKRVVDCSQLQYAIIFVPFVNAFASLVVATAKCFAEVNRVSRLCKLQRKAEARDEEEADIEIIPDAQQPSTCNKCFTSGKRCSKSLWWMLAQWLVPAIFSATLSLGEKLDQRRMITNESLGCTYAMNFPLLESVVCQGVDYLNSEDHLMFVGLNATDTLEVIRKISEILRDVSTNLEANKSHYTSEQMIDIVEEVKEDFRSFRTGRLLKFDASGKINCTEEHRNGTRKIRPETHTSRRGSPAATANGVSVNRGDVFRKFQFLTARQKSPKKMLNQWQVEIPEEASEALTLARFDAYLGRGVSVDCLIIKTQLEHGSIGWIDNANVGESRSTDGNAALHFAVLRRRRYLLEYLLRRGADLSIKNARGETALDMLLRSPHLAGQEEAFCNRQEHECDLEMLACLERWCLEAYGERHNLRQMHFRSAKKARAATPQPHHHNRQRDRQRPQKCTKSDLNTVISRDCPIWPGWTALHLAVVYGNCGEVKWLLDNGADPGVRDADGNTPLHFAPLNSTFNADLFSRLFVYDSDTFGGLNGLNHFHIACLNPKYIDVAREFLMRGHSPDTPARKGKLYYVDHNHWTPLHMAAKHSRIDLLKLLLEFNAKVDSRDQKECTAFHINVLLNRNVYCAKLLLEAGTDFDGLQGLSEASVAVGFALLDRAHGQGDRDASEEADFIRTDVGRRHPRVLSADAGQADQLGRGRLRVQMSDGADDRRRAGPEADAALGRRRRRATRALRQQAGARRAHRQRPSSSADFPSTAT